MSKQYSLIPEETAIVIIDMQNSFVNLRGSIGRNGYDASMMNGTIPYVKELVEACRENSIQDIWVTQNHYKEDVTRETHRIRPHTHRWKAGSPAIVGTWESEIVDELKPLADSSSEIIIKHRFSAFIDTRLKTLLRMKGINTLIVCGVGTAYFVESIVRDAYQLDYDVLVAEEGVAGMSIEDHESSINIMKKVFGLTLKNNDMLNLINGGLLSLELKTEEEVKY